MRAQVAAAIFALLLSTTPHTAGSGAQTIELQGPSWAAFRYNFSGPQVRFDIDVTHCFKGSLVAAALFLIIDGEVREWTAAPATVSWSPLRDTAEVGVRGRSWTVSSGLADPRCSSGVLRGYGPEFGGTRSVTAVIFSISENSWMTPVIGDAGDISSSDRASGPLLVATKANMTEVAYGSAYPAGSFIGGGVGMRKEFATSGNTLGWFMPRHPDAVGSTEWTCERSAMACRPPDQDGVVWFMDSNGGQYTLSAAADVEAFQWPYVALAVGALPDPTFFDRDRAVR